MAMEGGSSSGAGSGEVQVGFAKLQGEDFHYYMQTYSILLGRNSRKSKVDVDLARLGGGMNISRIHARIFYDFPRRRFALEVLGKNGCLVEGVHHLPGCPPVKLDSQDLLQIGDKKFYFLLPVRSILGATGGFGPLRGPLSAPTPRPARRQPTLPTPPPPPPLVTSSDDEDDNGENDSDGEEEKEGDDDKVKDVISGDGQVGALGAHGVGAGLAGKAGSSGKKKEATSSRANREADYQHRLEMEEKDVIASVATVISDLCGPGEWTTMEKLHSVLLTQYGNTWHQSRVRRYLTSEDWPSREAKGREWFGLLVLLRKYPEHFVINVSRRRGKTALEYVSLVSLIE